MPAINYNNGTLTATVTGGTAPYTFKLTQNGSLFTYGGANFINPINSSSGVVQFGDAGDLSGAHGLPPGTYKVEITDSQGCVIVTNNLIVGQEAEPTTTLATTLATTTEATTTEATTTEATTTEATTTEATTTEATTTEATTTEATTTEATTTEATTTEATTTEATTTEATTTEATTTEATTTEATTTEATTLPTTLATTTEATTLPTTLATTTEATTLPTTLATTIATTQAPAETGYFFHLGNGGYPYTQDLIGGTWYKQDNSVAADFADGFADALANPGSYETVATISDPLANGFQMVYPQSTAQNFYWLLVPDSWGTPDLTTVAKLADTQNNIPDVAADKLATSVNGNPYTLYKLNLLSTTQAVTIQYVDA
jgi:hypothetical protein